jgi:hypothetical protein
VNLTDRKANKCGRIERVRILNDELTQAVQERKQLVRPNSAQKLDRSLVSAML